MAVAAQDPHTVNDCIDLINKLCVILDTDEDLNEIKKVQRVDKPKGKKGKPPGNASGGKGGNNVSNSTEWCWDCGSKDHRRNKCPEHFKFKPNNWGTRNDLASIKDEESETDPKEQEEVKDTGSQ